MFIAAASYTVYINIYTYLKNIIIYNSYAVTVRGRQCRTDLSMARRTDVIINCTHTIAVCVLVSVQSGDRRQLKCVCVCVYL